MSHPSAVTEPESHLLAVTPYGRAGASSRVRVFDWLDHLSLTATSLPYIGSGDHSTRTLARALPSVVRAETRLRALTKDLRSSTVLLSRVASPFSRGRLESRLLKNSARGVYDFDDALWADQRSGLHALFSKPDVWRRSVEAADVVIAGSTYLAEAASKVSSDVHLVPSCVDPASYLVKTDFALRDGAPRFVWLGSPSTEAHLKVFAGAMNRVHQQTGARLTVISGEPTDLGTLEPITDRTQWSPHSFAPLLLEADVAIAPLADTEFARGKCAYKVLQYAAAGLPIVGSPVGANAEALTALGGLTARSEDDWVNALMTLLCDQAARESAGRTARRGVMAEYSFERWQGAWSSAVLGAPPSPIPLGGVVSAPPGDR